MVNGTTSKLRGLVLAAEEVRRETGWSDPMVEDYLSFLENIVTVAEEVERVDADEPLAQDINRARIGQLSRLIVSLQDEIADLEQTVITLTDKLEQLHYAE